MAPRFRLYNIVTQTWRSIACRGLCGRLYYLTSLAAVGARWLALSVEPHDPCGDGVHNSCGPTRYLFYSIATGRRVSPTIGPRTFVDLNAAKLTRRLCEPLYPVTTSVLFPQTVTLDDGLAVVEEQGGIFVERCKSPRRVTIVNGAYAGTLLAASEAAMFCAAEHLNGIFLPSELRFVATLPSGMTCGTLGPRHLYVTDPTGKIWAARLTAPRQR